MATKVFGAKLYAEELGLPVPTIMFVAGTGNVGFNCLGVWEIFAKPMDPTFPVPAINILVGTYKPNYSAYNFTSNTFAATSYFSPLRTVILLV